MSETVGLTSDKNQNNITLYMIFSTFYLITFNVYLTIQNNRYYKNNINEIRINDITKQIQKQNKGFRCNT